MEKRQRSGDSFRRINALPSYVRTLKKSRRTASHERKKPSQFIMPWVKDIKHRYQPRIVAAASLLGMPTEIRQRILLWTVDMVTMKAMTRQDMGEWIGVLSGVAPLIRMDLTYHVSEVWKREKTALERSAEEKSGGHPVLGADLEMSVHRTRKNGKELKHKGQKTKRRRDPKCWHCDRRHASKGPACPPAMEDPKKWIEDTKVSKVRKADRGKAKLGTHTTFN